MKHFAELFVMGGDAKNGATPFPSNIFAYKFVSVERDATEI